MNTYTLQEVQDMSVDFRNLDIPVNSIGHSNLDEFYKYMDGNITDITGYPYSGKTLFLLEILYNLAEQYGKRNLLHLPDAGKPEEVFAVLFQRRTGKTFDKRYINLIEEEEILKEVNWIHHHFPMVKKNVEKKGNKIKVHRPTPYEFWEYACSTDCDTASIDSWNYMKHEKNHGSTEYLAEVLSYRNELSEQFNKHFFTIIHPPKPTEKNFNKEGRLIAPTQYDLMGGSEWANNAKNVIAVHKEDKESQEYDIYVRKTKPRIIGKTGWITLNFDITTQRFYTVKNGSQCFAFEGGNLDSFGGLPDTSNIPF